MNGLLLIIPLLTVLLLLIIWSLLIFYHLRAYALRGDGINAAIRTLFMAGCLIFILTGLVLFGRTPWKDLDIEPSPEFRREILRFFSS